MFVMRARADVSADFMEDSRDFQEQHIMFVELVKILEVGDKMLAKFPDILAVTGIGLVSVRQNPCGTQYLGGEGVGEFARGEKIMQETLLVFADRDVDFLERKRFGDREVDLQRGDQRLGGLVIELKTFDRFQIAESRGFGGEMTQFFQRTGLVVFGDETGDRLDFITDQHEAFDRDIGVVVTELGEVSGRVFADHAQ